jgi:hypothetical protein
MTGKYPKVEFRKIEPLQEFFDDGYGNRWSVARLIDDTKHLKPFDAPIACINLSERIWKDCDIYDLAFHCKKVMDADLTKPIILAWDGGIADGRHRLIKALCLGKTTIKAVRMTWRPTPCSPGN